jgi:UDP-N-acetylglucosamine 4,6-dehydratase (inverting)
VLNDKVILITGGTGSFGHKFTETIFRKYEPKKIIIYSRDEHKQLMMRERFRRHEKKMRYFIGDVRDKDRLMMAFEGVDIVIHAAALKQVQVMEYNPIEAVKTNIYGAENVINSALDRNVNKVIALSTDKAVYPVNLYGATKMVSDKLFVNANAYQGSKDISFSVVRYGNVAGSRGSVIPYFKSILELGGKKLPITDFGMTRFWVNLDEGVELVFKAIDTARGSEILVSKSPSFKIPDLARAMNSHVELEEVGIREGEKLHEWMITKEDSRKTYDFGNHYIIYPETNWWDKSRHFTPGGSKVGEDFEYSSQRNDTWLDVDEIKKELKKLDTVA